MTHLAFVGYPTLNKSDHQWIESFRARHDPQASRIAAHFTLVFPAPLAAGPVLAHASAVLEGARPIPFVVRRPEPVPDRIGGGSHVFLVPEEGRDEIVALHDHFLPHITAAGSAAFEECHRLAEELTREHLPVQGVIEGVHLIEVASDTVTTVRRFALERRAPPTD